MTTENKFILEKFIDGMPVQFHLLRKIQEEDTITLRLVSSKNYGTTAMSCYPPNKPISRLLKQPNEKNS